MAKAFKVENMAEMMDHITLNTMLGADARIKVRIPRPGNREVYLNVRNARIDQVNGEYCLVIDTPQQKKPIA